MLLVAQLLCFDNPLPDCNGAMPIGALTIRVGLHWHLELVTLWLQLRSSKLNVPSIIHWSPPLPGEEGSCLFPIRVEAPTSFMLDPCSYSHSTADNSNPDAVMFIGASNTSRRITVETSGADTELYVFTFCPDDAAGTSQVRVCFTLDHVCAASFHVNK